jgi:phage terminase large subunit GpA-like protein
MTPAAENLREHIRAIYAPIDRRSVVDWCSDEVILSERQTQMPGNFSVTMTPYLREPLECFGDIDISDLVLVFGTQTGKTTMIQAGTAWRIVNKPQPMVWVMPTESLARSFSETRWMPLFDDSPTLAAQKPTNPHKFKNLEQHFSRCSVVFVGSNSPANLASRPAGLLLMDEVDKFAKETDQETSALLLAENRTKSFVSALRVKTSTPTTVDGAIWKEYLKGTQEKFMVPCPHCSEKIELLWEQVKWDKEARDGGKWNMARVEESAHYVCQSCQGSINDGQKIEMLQSGTWQSTNPSAQKGFRSFHLNSLYAPWRSCSFGPLAVKFLRDKETLNGLQDFTNSTMAMPWEQVETSIGDARVLGLKGDYEIGTCPIDNPARVVTCADVGQSKQHWVTCAFDENGASYVLDYGTTHTVEDLLTDPPSRTYKTPSGEMIAPECGLIDSGYATFRVYAACQASGGFYYPAKGTNVTFGTRISRTVIDNFPGVVLYSYVDHAIKMELFIDRIKDAKPELQIPKKVSSEFLAGLSGQKLVPRKTPSGQVFVWKDVRDDHFMDALKLCHIAWHIMKN